MYTTSLLSPEQQQILNESIRQKSPLSFDSCVTDRKPVNKGNEYQLYIG